LRPARDYRPSGIVLAQMAEPVDAMVSNTITARCAGSTPALGTRK
jgi:hypothetical protein